MHHEFFQCSIVFVEIKHAWYVVSALSYDVADANFKVHPPSRRKNNSPRMLSFGGQDGEWQVGAMYGSMNKNTLTTVLFLSSDK